MAFDSPVKLTAFVSCLERTNLFPRIFRLRRRIPFILVTILIEHKVLDLTYINPYRERILLLFAEWAGGRAWLSRGDGSGDRLKNITKWILAR